MGHKGRRRFAEFGKDLLIVFLTLSAIYLTLRSQSAVDLSEGGGGLVSMVMSLFQRDTGAAPPIDRTEGQSVEVRPLRMSVNLAGVGTYGVQYDAPAVDKLFDKMFSLLGEALGAAGTPQSVPEHVWRSALVEQSNVYFDFQGQVPLAALYAWTEAGPGEAPADVDIRRLLLAEDGSGALTVYYSNETTGMYYACGTSAALNGHLQTTAAPYAANVNGVTFAFEHKPGGGYEALAPYVMLPKSSAPAAWPVYHVSNPIAGGQNDAARTDMIEALGFHPQANTTYVAGGKQVVRDGADTLSLYDTGAVDYHSASASEPQYPVGDGAGTPSELEIMEATQRLVKASVGALCGDGRTVGVYLQKMTRLDDGVWQTDYGYQLNGAAVQLGSESYAARFIISGGRVSDFYLILRNYTALEECVSVLPELQAAAAMGALEAGGKELLLSYVDQVGTETIYPGWIAE